jgi:hypothetical protein
LMKFGELTHGTGYRISRVPRDIISTLSGRVPKIGLKLLIVLII